MNANSFAFSAISSLALVATSLVFATPALAQQASSTHEEITVVGPRLVRSKTEPGGFLRQITLTSPVSYADLNLALPADAMKLEQRIKETAKEVCQNLARMYPKSAPNNPDCVEVALRRAMNKAHAAIEAAKQR